MQSGPRDDSDYRRPNRRWLCGRNGAACARGPGVAGGCRGVAACRPQKRQQRWHCQRPAHLGDHCQYGPLADGRCGLQHPPCLPRRSSDGLRQLLVTLVLALSLGVALLGLGLGWW
jgi:hypothetical protein